MKDLSILRILKKLTDHITWKIKTFYTEIWEKNQTGGKSSCSPVVKIAHKTVDLIRVRS